jgi:hypothetical protein
MTYSISTSTICNVSETGGEDIKVSVVPGGWQDSPCRSTAGRNSILVSFFAFMMPWTVRAPMVQRKLTMARIHRGKLYLGLAIGEMLEVSTNVWERRCGAQ